MFKAILTKATAKKLAVVVAATTTVGGLSVATVLNADLFASGAGVHAAHYPWYHDGFFNTLDHQSVRRGYEVYKQVCAACHSMKYTSYRHLVGVSHTEDEAKAEAAEAQIPDGPNEQGDMFTRPGKLSDTFPNPYRNDEEAKAANNGALPPDLSLMAFARKGGANYIFSLLTGYCDPPAGVEAKDLHYNPYFPGNWINMRKALYDEIIEYSDGTPASLSQLAKDVTEFLRWSAEKSHDEKKKLLLKTVLFFPPLIVLFYYYKRRVFSVLKSKKIQWISPKNTGNGKGAH
jgi:ubiquinol-cytochrome c reductase cytochrome c1 subunit